MLIYEWHFFAFLVIFDSYFVIIKLNGSKFRGLYVILIEIVKRKLEAIELLICYVHIIIK